MAVDFDDYGPRDRELVHYTTTSKSNVTFCGIDARGWDTNEEGEATAEGKIVFDNDCVVCVVCEILFEQQFADE